MDGLNEAEYRRLFENLGFICLAVDGELRISTWNRQAAARFGRSAGIGGSILNIFTEGDRAAVEAMVRRSFREGRAGELEVKYPGERGEGQTFVAISSPILDDAGNCTAVSLSMRDISERKRLSRDLAASRRMSALGSMAKGVAHHFNNILGGMLTSIEYVLTSDSPRELRRTLRLLAESIGRATRITRQLEAFAASEHDTPQWMDLDHVVEGFLEWARGECAKKGIELVSEIEEVASRPMESQRLRPVLESVARNALDAMCEGGKLRVEVRREDDEAVILIADSGCGIPEEVLERVFEPFFTTKGELGGGGSDNTGMGLASVHGLVKEMGGSIRLRSKVGEGTTAEMRLPLGRAGAGVEIDSVRLVGR